MVNRLGHCRPIKLGLQTLPIYEPAARQFRQSAVLGAYYGAICIVHKINLKHGRPNPRLR